MIGSALAMKTLEAMGYMRNLTLHCHRMENRCAHLDISIEGTHGGHQTSFLISYPWYFGVCLEDLLGRDYMPTDPTNARTTSLGQPLFQWRPKFGKPWYIN